MTETSMLLKPTINFLHHYQPFSEMSAIHQEYLAMHLEQVFFAEKDIILSAQSGRIEYLYIIKSGQVKLNSLAQQKPLQLFNPGECFPIDSLLNKQTVDTSYSAVKSTICYKLKYQHFEYLMQQSNTFRLFIAPFNQHNKPNE